MLCAATMKGMGSTHTCDLVFLHFDTWVDLGEVDSLEDGLLPVPGLQGVSWS